MILVEKPERGYKNNRLIQKMAKQSFAYSPDTSRPIPQGDEFYHRLRKLFKLQPLTGLKGRDDARCEEYETTYLAAPPVLRELVELIRDRGEVVNEKACMISYGCYTRRAGMKIGPPLKNTINRVMMNFGNEELIRLDPRVEAVDTLIGEIIEQKTKVKLNSGLPEKEVLLLPNKFLEMGTITSSNYMLLARKDPHYQRPDTVEAGTIIKGKATIRPGNYLRVFVVIDFISVEESIRAISEKAREVTQHISMEAVKAEMEKVKKRDKELNKQEERKLPRREEEEVDKAMNEVQQKRA